MESPRGFKDFRGEMKHRDRIADASHAKTGCKMVAGILDTDAATWVAWLASGPRGRPFAPPYRAPAPWGPSHGPK